MEDSGGRPTGLGVEGWGCGQGDQKRSESHSQARTIVSARTSIWLPVTVRLITGRSTNPVGQTIVFCRLSAWLSAGQQPRKTRLPALGGTPVGPGADLRLHQTPHRSKRPTKSSVPSTAAIRTLAPPVGACVFPAPLPLSAMFELLPRHPRPSNTCLARGMANGVRRIKVNPLNIRGILGSENLIEIPYGFLPLVHESPQSCLSRPIVAPDLGQIPGCNRLSTRGHTVSRRYPYAADGEAVKESVTSAGSRQPGIAIRQAAARL